MSLNTHYIFLTKNPRDGSQVQLLARRMKAKNYQYIVDAYHHATREPYTYLLFDCEL